MKVGVICETRYLAQNMPSAVVAVLRQRGCDSDVLCPDGACFTVDSAVLVDSKGQSFRLLDYDLIVSRNRNALGLVLLRFAEEAGIAVINTHSAVQKVRNKAKMAVALAQTDICAAPTFLASSAEALARHFTGAFPIILKATYGDNSRGLQLVRSREELSEIEWPADVVLAQSYLANDGYDLKLYVCGEHVFAVRKPSPFNGDPSAPSIPVDVTPALVSLARTCGKLFGLELYGVDCVETAAGPVVIEVNDFPNYTGVPGAAELIASQVLSRAEQALATP